jgi:hypothetical protein
MPPIRSEPRGHETKWKISASFYADGFTILSENMNTVKIKATDVFYGSKVIGLKVSLEKIK